MGSEKGKTVYIFKFVNIIRPEDQVKYVERVKEQLEGGVVFLDPLLSLVSISTEGAEAGEAVATFLESAKKETLSTEIAAGCGRSRCAYKLRNTWLLPLFISLTAILISAIPIVQRLI